MTTAVEEAIADSARRLEVSTETVQSLFDLIDSLRAEYHGDWRKALPEELLILAKDGEPWAVEVLEALVSSALIAEVDV